MYQRTIQIFYANIKYEGMSVTSRISETKFSFTMEEFGIICKISAYGRTYNVYDPNDSLNFNHVFAIESFLINPMREKKPLKKKFMKTSSHFMHRLVTIVLHLRRESHVEILK